MATNQNIIGKRVIRSDSLAKVTGTADYTADLKMPNMLVAKVLRSPHAHARINSIDVSEALKMPGVKAAISGFDGYGIKWGVFRYTQDHDMLPTDKVRYIGEDVAAVAAVDEQTAIEALSRIKVDYEPLPAVYDPIEAMQDGAPLIHDQYKNNINIHVNIEEGEVDKAMERAFLVREDTFKSAGEAYAMMEPYAVVASYKNGYLDLWMPNAGPHVRAKAIANLLKMPLNKVRVRHINSGGAFGGRSEVAPGDLVASLLAIKSGKPVKLVLSREENATSTRQIHDMIATIKTGMAKDGTIVAKDYRVIYDGGAYSSTGPIATSIPYYVYEECYRLPNVRYNGYRIITNKGIRGMYGCHGRAFMGGNEAQMDLMAKELGMDPVEIRLKNGLTAGEMTATKSKITSCGLKETIHITSEKTDFKKRWAQTQSPKGIGMGCIAIMCGFPMGFRSLSTCYLKINDDGYVTLVTGVVDNGQGNESMVIQAASEILGVPMEDINLVNADTEVTNLDPGAYSQAAAFVSTNAVKVACENARQQIATIAAEKLGVPETDIALKDRLVYSLDNPEKKMPLRWVVREAFARATPIAATGTFFPNIDLKREWISRPWGQMAGTFSYATSVAEVSIDPETGEVTVPHFTAAHDCGRAINPMAVEGQMEGSVQQAGMAAITEGNLWDGGHLLNPDLLDYKIPLACDMPEIDAIIVESIDPAGPFGAKEGGIAIRMNAYSAIACAVTQATGTLFKEFPLTPDKVLELVENGKEEKR
ncbi:dehydrogenase [Desulfosarcina ovata subsp. sediminis]|uniref:Dehydrogenase n=1 Tax=Desulfosarcina ovata subsp. sediminis TaxID=885957 RepID=A0A5K7ZXW6_9BACT|nr:xanthine dehydrogenase family protein molybdopterin-binding subunit [Desulfosarcina ovata]BBO85078.1 dehydrogenase [Desulfosarcina ovata subsp. sediminis]